LIVICFVLNPFLFFFLISSLSIWLIEN
jgi:hypothetical protein